MQAGGRVQASAASLPSVTVGLGVCSRDHPEPPAGPAAAMEGAARAGTARTPRDPRTKQTAPTSRGALARLTRLGPADLAILAPSCLPKTTCTPTLTDPDRAYKRRTAGHGGRRTARRLLRLVHGPAEASGLAPWAAPAELQRR